MSQSRKMSAIESIVNIALGMLIALATQLVVFPWFGIHVGYSQNIAIVCIFTVVSFVRSYALRRLFNSFKKVTA